MNIFGICTSDYPNIPVETTFLGQSLCASVTISYVLHDMQFAEVHFSQLCHIYVVGGWLQYYEIMGGKKICKLISGGLVYLVGLIWTRIINSAQGKVVFASKWIHYLSLALCKTGSKWTYFIIATSLINKGQRYRKKKKKCNIHYFLLFMLHQLVVLFVVK